MCGIIGYVGRGDVVSNIIKGLRELEYRGYDSYGICALTKNSHFLHRDVGIISRDLEEGDIDEDNYLCGIGHTRWATHGKVTVENSHPQFNKSKTIFVVHNGTVDNAPSNTLDTQHIVDKLEEKIGSVKNIGSNFFSRVINSVVQTLKGDNAFLVLHQNLPDRIFCVTKGSKSLLVTSNGYVSSDSCAIAGKDKEARRIKNSVVCLSDKGIVSSIKMFEGESSVEPLPQETKDQELTEPHHMIKEIKEQPFLIEDIRDIGFFPGNLSPPPKRLNLIGCGSSYYAAMWAKNWFEKLAKIPTIVSYGSEATYHLHDAETANIFISQSGETKDIIHAFLATTSDNNYLITNSINSYLGNSIFQTISIGAGPEYGVAATKTFTMTCFALWEMAWRWADKNSRYDNEGTGDLDSAAEGLVAGINHVLDCEEVIRTLAKMIARYDNVLFLGRYCDYPIALEGALKLKEVSYIHAEGMPAAEMKHGPIALVDEKTPSIFVVNTDLHLDSIISNMREIKSRGGKIFAISDAVTHDRVAEVADWSFRCHNMYSLAMRPLASNVVLQLLAYHVAVAKGLNPDRPRNLAKSVTV